MGSTVAWNPPLRSAAPEAASPTGNHLDAKGKILQFRRPSMALAA